MKLLTAALKKALPPLRSQEAEEDPIVVAKFFGGGACTWFALEFDGRNEFFGFVSLGMGPGCDELGSFFLSELEAARFPPFNLGVERDMYWKPMRLSEAKKTLSS